MSCVPRTRRGHPADMVESKKLHKKNNLDVKRKEVFFLEVSVKPLKKQQQGKEASVNTRSL